MLKMTKKEYNKKHKDYKGMIDGKPYALWLNPETNGTELVPVEIIKEDKPEQGKIYALTGGTKDKSIAQGNTWAESIVTEGNK